MLGQVSGLQKYVATSHGLVFQRFNMYFKGSKLPLPNFENQNTATYRRDGNQFLSETQSHRAVFLNLCETAAQ